MILPLNVSSGGRINFFFKNRKHLQIYRSIHNKNKSMAKVKADIHASECKCIKCGQQAVAFWPVIDLDIQSHPYCRQCLDKIKRELFIKLYQTHEKK